MVAATMRNLPDRNKDRTITLTAAECDWLLDYLEYVLNALTTQSTYTDTDFNLARRIRSAIIDAGQRS